MPKIRASNVSAHKALIRAQLLDAFEELLLTTPYEDVSIAAVAARAGVARNTVYNYAKDKAELLSGAARRHVGLMVGPMQAAAAGATGPEARLRAVLHAVLDRFADAKMSPRVFQELMKHGTQEDIDDATSGSDALLPLLLQLLREGAESGVFRSWEDQAFLLDLLAGVFITSAQGALSDPERAQQHVDDGIDFVMGALRG